MILSIIFFIFKWLPESARYHVASGQTDKALATLEQVAKDNGKPMLLGRLVIDDSPNHQGIPYNNEESGVRQRGRFRDLLRPAMRKTSLLLWFIWMSCAFCYYGLVLMTTELFETSAANCKSESQPNSSTTLQDNCAANCRTLQTTDYMDLLWTTLAEFPGTLIVIQL